MAKQGNVSFLNGSVMQQTTGQANGPEVVRVRNLEDRVNQSICSFEKLVMASKQYNKFDSAQKVQNERLVPISRNLRGSSMSTMQNMQNQNLKESLDALKYRVEASRNYH